MEIPLVNFGIESRNHRSCDFVSFLRASRCEICSYFANRKGEEKKLWLVNIVVETERDWKIANFLFKVFVKYEV